MKKVGILGGGIAGITTAIELESKGFDVTLIEKNEFLGGLANSFCLRDHYYDIGPHIVFSKHQDILEYMLNVDQKMWNTFERINCVYTRGKYINYPFENYLGQLPKNIGEECLSTFLNNPFKKDNPENMEEFFLSKFGLGIVNHYLKPYNEKIWKSPLSDLDLQMVSRIPDPPKEDIISGFKGNYIVGYTHQASFRYPKKGGIGTFVERLSSKLKKTRTVLNASVNEISTNDESIIVTTNKKSYEFENFISTIPLRELINLIDSKEIPVPIQETTKKLKHLSLAFGLVLTNEKPKEKIFSLTIPDEKIIFHRLNYINFLEDFKSETHAYLYEITYWPESIIQPSLIKKKVIDGLKTMGLIKDQDSIVDFSCHFSDYAYVVYDLDHRENVNKVRQFLESRKILTVGRFGSHEYYNMDQVILQVKNLTKNYFYG